MMQIRHAVETVDDRKIFFREAGDRTRPTVVLLHGAPSSSHMFRDLIPRLAHQYHVLAPDYLGFGYSDAPGVAEFAYTFDALTDSVAGFLAQRHVSQYVLYVQDYGAPIGWRLALRRPDSVSAIITQNGNAYREGFTGPFWEQLWAYAAAPSSDTEAPMRAALSLDSFRRQYLQGEPDTSVVSPDAWMHALQGLQRPGGTDLQLALFRDYPSNVDLYPAVQKYFRTSQVPLLAVWGRNDPIFGPAGALSFRTDLPEAEIHLLDGGHWVLESQLSLTLGHMRDFLGRVL
jgi:pimeloyl-ACP methyl ester carboxylesterase